MKANKSTLFALTSLIVSVTACQTYWHTNVVTPVGSESSTCQAPPIEKNIVGTWHFVSNRGSTGVGKEGTVTFDSRNNIIDPDSLFENYNATGYSSTKIVAKTYDTNGTYSSVTPDYLGKIFVVDLFTKTGGKTIWPLYVLSNECKKIVVNQLASYNSPVKIGFTLTR